MRESLDLFGTLQVPAHLSAFPAGFLPHLAGIDALPAQPLPIAEMADLFGVTHRTLHFYEEKNLLIPERTGTMRIYDTGCVMRMMVINTCREIGMTLADIQDLMERLSLTQSQLEADELFRDCLSTHRRRLVTEISLITRKITRIRTIMSSEEEPMPALSTAEPPARLSDMEKRCLGLMTEGYKGGSLALALGICSGELQRLEDTIMTKLDAANRYQAAAKAILSGMLPN
ncbi:MerR family transcriptional regulator [Neorhizobium sp. JUb45]|uniref:MerR family transcriptional regulator n=1 Tax=unclassified Neorhizobium TaxID=2629175 RepID=UPI0010491085|nr:MerR family transcriptional regulator [Neorhizobium sp. JUb45]TCR07086.1 transcriptional regulator [Neorhizobium sp. JUb45]